MTPPAGATPSGARTADTTILVVEDEDALRRLVVRMLERMGYRTLEAGDGVGALAIVREADGPVHLILSDVVMPRLNGPDMARELRDDGHDMPVAFMSGYSGRALIDEDQSALLLAKPFTMEELEAFVESALEGGGG